MHGAVQMVYCTQTLEWLRDHSSHLNHADVRFTLEEFKEVTKHKPWGASRSRLPSCRSEAMMSVIASGVSIADISRTRSRGGSPLL